MYLAFRAEVLSSIVDVGYFVLCTYSQPNKKRGFDRDVLSCQMTSRAI